MINVNQITSQLARMPDQALQQYAMMHKNDPYTVSLALSESNRRKQMRDAAQGQQGMAPQPKVVDQGIAGMASPAPQPMPEDVGIGALPAPNMQGMAGGGIVAFSGQGPSVVQDMSPDAINERYRQAQLQKLKDLFGFTDTRRGFQSGFTPEEKLTGIAAPVTGPTPVVASSPASVVSYKPDTRGEALAQASLAASAVKPPPAAGPRPAPASGNKPPVAPVAPVAPVVPEQDYLTQLDEMRTKAGDVVDPLAKRRTALTDKQVKAEIAALAERKLEQKAEFEEMFKGKEERIGKREAELGKSKDTNTGMAFLEAGLAMMQARGPGLAGIAQGAGVGLKQYQSGIKDIRAAQEKLDDARDRIEELRQNQSSMNKSEVRTAEKGIRSLVYQGDRDLLKGVEDATGVREADFRATVTSNMSKAKEERERTFTAGEAEKTRKFQSGESALDRQNRVSIAGMPGEQQKLLSAFGGGDLKKGLGIMTELQADKTGAVYAKLFTETVAEANKNGVPPPTAAQFAASLKQLAAALNPTKVPPPVDATSASRN